MLCLDFQCISHWCVLAVNEKLYVESYIRNSLVDWSLAHKGKWTVFLNLNLRFGVFNQMPLLELLNSTFSSHIKEVPLNFKRLCPRKGRKQNPTPARLKCSFWSSTMKGKQWIFFHLWEYLKKNPSTIILLMIPRVQQIQYGTAWIRFKDYK